MTGQLIEGPRLSDEERMQWQPSSLSVVVPVFNEESNAQPLVERIF